MSTKKEAPVVIELSKEQAERIQFELSDLACWAKGFAAALPEGTSRHPMGIEAVQTLNILFKKALNAHENRS